MLRVYWHPKDSDPVKSPKRVDIDFYGQQTHKPNIGCRIAEFPLSSRYNAGLKTKSHSGVTVSFDVLESNVSETEEEEMSEYETEKRLKTVFVGSSRLLRKWESISSLVEE